MIQQQFSSIDRRFDEQRKQISNLETKQREALDAHGKQVQSQFSDMGQRMDKVENDVKKLQVAQDRVSV